MGDTRIIEQVPGLYSIRPLRLFRKTLKVTFDFVPIDSLTRIDAIDRVIHEGNAMSPGQVGSIARPWYMHPFQEDNLIVLCGTRHVELYTPGHGRIERFTVAPDSLVREGGIVLSEGVMLSWPTHVFHRITSGPEGSAAVNLATHLEGFDIRNNFSIYDLDISSGDYKVIRAGYLDQPQA